MSIVIEGITKEDFFRILLGANCGMFQKEKLDSYYGYKVKEIPPHGRLIDADALTNIINQSITEEEKVFNSIKEDPIGKHGILVDINHDKRIIRILGNAPTIIEGEEE